MSKSPYSPEWRAMIAQRYLDGEAGAETIAAEVGLSPNTVRCWAKCYAANGMAAFDRGSGNSSYSAELKKECVESYLSGEMSINEIVAHYNLSSKSVVKRWIKKYNANKELRDYDPKREVYMAEARRKTTKEERIEIVKYCLDHGKDYKGTASKYDVSYSQVLSWVRKYDTYGEEGLTDKRGRPKKDDEIDEMERMRRENQRLKRKLEEKDMTIELLKKVKEFERK